MTISAEQLIAAARETSRHAYAPFSGFHVGAAVAADDSVFCGCNVENASYGLTMCAERVALGAAVAANHRQFQAIAIVSLGAVLPCGACRQVISELAPNARIYLADIRGEEYRTLDLTDIFPEPFGADSLPKSSD